MSESENPLPPVLGPKPAPILPPPSSPLFARLLNVLAIPGHVFEEVRASRHSIGNWLVPVPLYAISLALFALTFVSMPAIQKLWDEQASKLRATQSAELAKEVEAGKIKQADADLALAQTEWMSQPAVLKGGAVLGGFGFGIARVFWWAFVLWLLARLVLRTPIPYGKALEVAGLATVVGFIGNMAVVALTVEFGKSFADGALAWSVSDFKSERHQLLVSGLQYALNFWLIAVLGTGLARLTQMPWIRGAFLVATYWLASEFLLLLLAAGLGR